MHRPDDSVLSVDARPEKNFAHQSVHRKFTKRPQDFHTRVRRRAVGPANAGAAPLALTDPRAPTTLESFMDSRSWTASIALAVLLVPMARGPAAAADESATLLRVFLRDGSSLVSFGEPARVGDRVVFSMPTSAVPNPPLHLVNLPVEKVDWDRTDRYASAARRSHYLNTQAELDFAALSSKLAQTLNDVAATPDPSQRLAIVERARAVLSQWPAEHFNYRQAEVRQMVGLLDEAIADLRVASGVSRFDLSLTAFAEAPPNGEPLLPSPSMQESIQQVIIAAQTVDNAAERASLMKTALAAIDANVASLPATWASATRTELANAVRADQAVDSSYRALTRGIMMVADRRARMADVRGVERLLTRIQQRDQELGLQRPEAVNALVTAVEAKLDATRRLRLARDRWELRLPVLVEYGAAIRAPIALFVQLKPALEDIKALAGSTPGALRLVQDGTARLLKLMSDIPAPDEVSAAHALMISAAQLAASAVAARREAALLNDMDRAWNASSAAAGALMLGSRARADILTLLRPPQLR
jgi:hypothetical protein